MALIKKLFICVDDKPTFNEEDEKPTKDETDSQPPPKESQEDLKQEAKDVHGELQPSPVAPLVKRHRRNSISLPAGLDNLEIQVS